MKKRCRLCSQAGVQNHEAAGNQPCASKPLKTSGEWTLKPPSSQEALPGCRKPNHRRRNSKGSFPPPTTPYTYISICQLSPSTEVSARFGLLGKWPRGVTSLVWRGRRRFEAGEQRPPEWSRGSKPMPLTAVPVPAVACLERRGARGTAHADTLLPEPKPTSGTDAATAQLGSAFDGSQSALWHSLQDGSKFTDQNLEEHGFTKR